MADEVPQSAPPTVSPTGQVVGLSALIAAAPPWLMNLVLAVVGLGVAAETAAQVAPELLPVGVMKAAHIIVAIAVVAGLASPGVRK